MIKASSVLRPLGVLLVIAALAAGLLYLGDYIDKAAREPFALELERLPALTPTSLREAQSEHDFACGSPDSGPRETLCYAEIGSFNGLRASYVGFYFDRQKRLTRMKLATHASAYPDLRQHFDQRYGAAQACEGGANCVVWQVEGGLLSTTATQPDGNEATFLWLAERALPADATPAE